MKTQTYFTSNIKKLAIHFVVFLIFIKLILICSTDFPTTKRELHIILTCIIAFYIHTLFFIPVLIKKRNLKKYLFLTVSSIVIVAFIVIWIQANHSSIITIHSDGSRSEPSDFYFNKDWIIGGLTLTFILFIPFSVLSLAYHIVIINSKERKKLFSLKYTEFIVNSTVVTSLMILIASNTIDNGLKDVYLFIIFSVAFYLNALVYTPLVLKGRNFIKYLLFNILSILFIIIATKIIYGIGFISVVDLSRNFINLITIFLTLIFLSFIYGYVRLKLKANQRLFHIKLGAKESELQLLKSQVNPHFLFNTLNTLYATALSENATKTAESTAKLANLLRYMQNDIHKDFIPLKNEINYVQDYIIIQKLRCAIEPEITTTFENVTNQSISPGLLIPFVENAFKYGIDPSNKSDLTIAIICDENTIHFTCVNSFNEHFKVHQTEEGFGIGIKNAKQRLDLVYPDQTYF